MSNPISTDIIFELQGKSPITGLWRPFLADDNIDRVRGAKAGYEKLDEERSMFSSSTEFRIVRVTTTREEV